MTYTLVVEFGCGTTEKNVRRDFANAREAVEAFLDYSDRADRGQWFERLELLTSPFSFAK